MVHRPAAKQATPPFFVSGQARKKAPPPLTRIRPGGLIPKFVNSLLTTLKINLREALINGAGQESKHLARPLSAEFHDARQRIKTIERKAIGASAKEQKETAYPSQFQGPIDLNLHMGDDHFRHFAVEIRIPQTALNGNAKAHNILHSLATKKAFLTRSMLRKNGSKVTGFTVTQVTPIRDSHTWGLRICFDASPETIREALDSATNQIRSEEKTRLVAPLDSLRSQVDLAPSRPATPVAQPHKTLPTAPKSPPPDLQARRLTKLMKRANERLDWGIPAEKKVDRVTSDIATAVMNDRMDLLFPGAKPSFAAARRATKLSWLESMVYRGNEETVEFALQRLQKLNETETERKEQDQAREQSMGGATNSKFLLKISTLSAEATAAMISGNQEEALDTLAKLQGLTTGRLFAERERILGGHKAQDELGLHQWLKHTTASALARKK